MKQYIYGILIFFSFPAYAQYFISGHVYDSARSPLAGTNIWTNDMHHAAVTDGTGYFIITGIPEGQYTLYVNLIGYKKIQHELTVQGHVRHLDIILHIDPVEMDEVVITADKYEQLKRKQILPVDIIRMNQVQENFSLNLARSFEQYPGFHSSDIGSGLGKPIIRGLSSNRIAVVENDIKQQGQQWGQEHGLEIDPFAIEAVELIKGPLSLQYGSDAIGGIIRILPVSAPQKNTFESSVSTTARSNNNLLGGSAYIGMRKEHNFFMLRFSEQHFGDLKIPDSDRMAALRNTAGNTRDASAIIGTQRSWGSSRITFSSVSQKMGMLPAEDGIPDLSVIKEKKSLHTIGFPYQDVNHLKIMSNTFIRCHDKPINIDLGFQQNNRKEMDVSDSASILNHPDGNTALNLILQTWIAHANQAVISNDRMEMTAGINYEYQQNRIDGWGFLLPAFNQMTVGVYDRFRYNVSGKNTIIGGIRYDYSRLNIDGFSDINGNILSSAVSTHYDDMAWSLGTAHRFNEKWMLKFNIGKSYRIPTALEMSSNGYHHSAFRYEKGDSSLRSEKAYQSDLILAYRSQYFEISLTPFISYFTNYIYMAPTNVYTADSFRIYQFTQSPSLRWGGEFYAKTTIIRKTEITLGADYVNATNLDNHSVIPFTPPFSVMGSARYILPESRKHHESYILYRVRYRASKNHVGEDEPATQYSFIHDISAATSVHLGKTELRLILSVQNIFNTLYYNHLSFYRMINIPEPGRNIQVMLQVPFKTGI